MKELSVELTFIEDVLGSQPAEGDVYRKFVASKAPDKPKMEDEVAALGVDAVEEKGMTVFPKLEDGTPFFWDYQIRGFFKSACNALNMAEPSKKLTNYKKKIDLLVFIKDRKIPCKMPKGSSIGNLQRPLRASTAQGERIALANSDTVPAGTKISFTIQILEDSLLNRVKKWLDYGQFNGLGQWRNASYGRFTWKEI